MKFRCSMPRELPKDGTYSYVFAFKTPNGARVEESGVLTEEKALQIIRILGETDAALQSGQGG